MQRTKALSNAATAILIVSVLMLFKRHSLIASHPAGLVVQGAAILLMLWARVTFGLRSFHFSANTTAGSLVTTGPYRFVRHPIYSAVLIFIWTGVLANPIATVSLALAVVGTLASAVRIWAEERFLNETYQSYRSYAARTKRVIPYVV